MKKTNILFLAFLCLTLVSCGEDSASSSSSSASSFSSDVDVSTTSSETESLTEVLENGNVKFADNTADEIAKARKEDSIFDPIATLSYELVNSNSCTSANVKVTSSNKAIIPEEAIKLEETTFSQSNVLTGGTLSVDLTKVQLGESYLTIEFIGHNGNSPKGTIRKKITVVKFGSITTTHFQQNVTFDFSKVANNASLLTGATITYSSLDVPYGCDIYEQALYSKVDVSSSKKQTVSFQAIPGIPYYLSVSYRDSSDKAHFFYLTKNQKIGSDYSYATDNTSSKAIYGYSTAATYTIAVLDQVTN